MTQPHTQPNPNELLSITREELERCCSQMSAAGYKVSANYVEAMVLSRSRTHTPAAPAERLCDDCNIIELEEKLTNLEAEIRAKILREVESDEWLKEHDNAIREQVLKPDILKDLQITSQVLYEFCEWFCDYDCEKKPCVVTISRLHERMEGIQKQMKDHPEYLAKWNAKRAEQESLRGGGTDEGGERR